MIHVGYILNKVVKVASYWIALFVFQKITRIHGYII